MSVLCVVAGVVLLIGAFVTGLFAIDDYIPGWATTAWGLCSGAMLVVGLLLIGNAG